jgi:hypothetical protein
MTPEKVLDSGMSTIVRTAVHKRSPRHFLVDGLQVWVTCLDTDDNEPFGMRIMWLEHKYSCSPLDHISLDDGNRFQKYSSFWMTDGTVDMRIEEYETNPEKLTRLNRILLAYQQDLGETVFGARPADSAR